jgi:hypothetical protein
MKSKKRIAAFSVAMAMILAVTPMTAFANDSGTDGSQEESECSLWVGGVAVTDSGNVTGKGIKGTVHYDSDKNVLTLSDATITGISEIKEENYTLHTSIYCNEVPLTIVLKGKNKVGDIKNPDISILADEDLTIKGSGSLDVKGSNYAIWATEDCEISDHASVTINCSYNAAISANKKLVIDDSYFTAKGGGYEGIRAQELEVRGSTVHATAKDTTAIRSRGSIYIIDSDITAESTRGSDKEYRFNAVEAYGSIVIANSSLNAVSDSQAAVLAGKKIRLSGSKIIKPASGTIGEGKTSGGRAILDKNGKEATRVQVVAPRDIREAIVSLEKSSYTYNKKAITPSAAVRYEGGLLEEGVHYTVSYKNNTNAGKATVIFTGIDEFKEVVKKTFTIKKAKNPIKVKTVKRTKDVKVNQKGKTTTDYKVASPFTVSSAQGTVTYKKTDGSLKITVAKKTGKITLKKGIKPGTYKVKVTVKAAGGKNYEAGTVKKTVKIKVK